MQLTIKIAQTDNQRLANLCGSLDENIKQIATGFNISIQRRGSSFSFDVTAPFENETVLLRSSLVFSKGNVFRFLFISSRDGPPTLHIYLFLSLLWGSFFTILWMCGCWRSITFKSTVINRSK